MQSRMRRCGAALYKLDNRICFTNGSMKANECPHLAYSSIMQFWCQALASSNWRSVPLDKVMWCWLNLMQWKPNLIGCDIWVCCSAQQSAAICHGYLSIHLFIHPSVCLSIHPSINIYLSFYFSILISFGVYVVLSIDLSYLILYYIILYYIIILSYLSIHPSIYISFYPTIYLPIHLSIDLSINLYLSKCLS